jgi:hypothetical protein
MLSYGTNKEKKKWKQLVKKQNKTDIKQFIIAAKVRN